MAKKVQAQKQTWHSSSDDAESEGDSGWYLVGDSPKRERSVSPEILTEDMRVVVEELVLITDFLPELLSEEKIARNCHFGKYGKVVKTIFSKKVLPHCKSDLAFITYQNHLDAALAIIALQTFSHMPYKCTTTYGTIRYCPAWIKFRDCTFTSCYFLHEMHENNLTVKDMRYMNQRQKMRGAYRKIRENLGYFIEKEHDEFISSRVKSKNNGVVMCSCNNENWGEIITLPTIKNTLARLVREGEIDGEQYQLVKKEYKLRIKKKFSQKEDVLSQTTQSEDLISQQTSALSLLTPEASPLTFQTSSLVLEGTTPLNSERDFPVLQKQGSKEDLSLPYLLRRYLDPSLSKTSSSNMENYYKHRQIELKEKIHNGRKTLSMYEKRLRPQTAINSYIHHKLLQEVSWRQPPLASLFDFAPENGPSNPKKNQQCLNFKSIVYKHLID